MGQLEGNWSQEWMFVNRKKCTVVWVLMQMIE